MSEREFTVLVNIIGEDETVEAEDIDAAIDKAAEILGERREGEVAHVYIIDGDWDQEREAYLREQDK